eukprot:12132660-Alexandrium_andersonii.AAC.1
MMPLGLNLSMASLSKSARRSELVVPRTPVQGKDGWFMGLAPRVTTAWLSGGPRGTTSKGQQRIKRFKPH